MPLSRLCICAMVFLFISCTAEKKEQEPLDIAFFPELTQKGELYYKIGEDEPFTGVSGSTYSTGDPYVRANFRQGKLDGLYTAYYSNGEKMGESHYSEGILDGVSESWHENGNKASEIRFVDGKRQGKMTIYYSSGLINAEGFFKDGELDSTYTRWNLEGEIEYVDTYDKGEFIEDSVNTSTESTE